MSVFARAPHVSDQVTSKFDAWEWVKHHARMYMDAPLEGSCRRRGIIGGMTSAFDRSLIAMARAKYALQWPPYLRTEFTTLRQGFSARRMAIFGWDLEPSASGFPSKRYWKKVKGIAEKMRACWLLDRPEVSGASPLDGPDGGPVERSTFGDSPSAGSPSAAPLVLLE